MVADREKRAAALDQTLDVQASEIIELRDKLADRELQIDLSQSIIAAINASASWRITSPLRVFKSLAQQLRDTIRYSLILGWLILRDRSLTPLQGRRAIDIIEQSGLFDKRWYLERNPDVAASGIDPVEHYVMHGWREGRDPSPSFSTRKYLMHNLNLATAGINPLAHFVLHRPGKGLNGFVSKLTGHLADRFRRGVYVFARTIYRAMPLRDTPAKTRLRNRFLRYLALPLPDSRSCFVAPPVIPPRCGPNLESLGNLNRLSLLSDPAAHFLAPTEEPLHDDGYPVIRFMYYLWRLRPDLMQAFNLYDRESRLEFCKWFLLNAPHEYVVPDYVYPHDLLIKLASTKGPLPQGRGPYSMKGTI